MKVFIDTNVVVYANDRRDSAKQGVAVELIARHLREGSGVLSTQVLQEYASVALTKLRQDPAVVIRQLGLLEQMEIVPSTPALVRRAVEVRDIYGLHFWDAGIVAAAEAAQCIEILSEDMGASQVYAGLRVRNPFASD